MIEQGTPEWHQQRLGKVTASKVADVMAKTRSGYVASRANYMAQLLVERLTGLPTESYVNDAMRWGTETEPQARDAYSFITDNDVAQVGFIDHPSIRMSGASPDGLVGESGLLEIKCPNTATHIEFLLNGEIADKYQKQMTWQMVCTDREWCDFVSFDPRLPADLQIRVERFHLEEKAAKEMEAEIEKFISELESKLDQLTKLRAAA